MAICCVSLTFVVAAYSQYASLLRISGALHLALFEQPGKMIFQQPDKIEIRSQSNSNFKILNFLFGTFIYWTFELFRV